MVTVTGLKENATYKYSYYVDGKWSEKYTYKTQSTDSFNVVYVGDPQIGASTGQSTVDGKTSEENGKEYYAMNDSYNWEHTLNQATSETKTEAGSDYYFTYGNTLFISINTNNFNCAQHEMVINEAVEKYPEAKWRVLFFHQDIYGSGYDHSDSDGMVLRTQLTPIIDEYDIDAVLQGHDHTYSRTYQLSANGTQKSFEKADSSDEYYEANASCYNILTGATLGTKVIDPDGTVYFEANSSTGSKFYQMIGTQQD